MKIVIVEDEMRIKEGLSNLIKKLYPDCEVAAMADNGKEGLECIRRIKPDLVFTDIRMPVMDGLEMLEKMEEEGIQAKTVILSAYTEFKYAQQAMRLGVMDYLIKLIVVGEFMKIMKRMEEEIEERQKEAPGEIGSLAYLLSAFLYGTMEYDAEKERYLSNKFGITKEKPLLILNCYLGKAYEEGVKGAKKELRFWLSERTELEYEILEVEKEKSLAVILYQYEDEAGLERRFQNRMLLDEREKSRYILSYGLIRAENAGALRDAYHTLLQYMDWNIVLGDRVLISWPKVLKIQTVFCVYPVELEGAMKAAVCASGYDRMEKGLEQFFEYFRSGKVYAPKEVKECFVRFLWNVISVVKEIRGDVLKEINQQKLLEEIMDARSIEELEGVSRKRLKMMQKENGEQELSLSVMRAKNMALEFYHTGITLEEIAKKLNLTAEYLGTQFRRETGVNFSIFIRDLRIAKAKELLIGSNMKQYEIAEQVGYSDSKYFGRVFKETVGLSPAEFRKANK